jgi:hypothetical protein
MEKCLVSGHELQEATGIINTATYTEMKIRTIKNLVTKTEFINGNTV